jgi:hypothetical protein
MTEIFSPLFFDRNNLDLGDYLRYAEQVHGVKIPTKQPKNVQNGSAGEKSSSEVIVSESGTESVVSRRPLMRRRLNDTKFDVDAYEREQKGLNPVERFVLIQEQVFPALVQNRILNTRKCSLNFSEPGAGKTLQSLFELQLRQLKLVVVGPFNANVTWENETVNYGFELSQYVTYDILRGTQAGRVGEGFLIREDHGKDCDFTITDEFLHRFKKGMLLVFDEIHMLMNEGRQRAKAAHTLILGALNYLKRNPTCPSRVILLTGSLTNKDDKAPWYTSMLGYLPKPDLNESDHIDDYLDEMKKIMTGKNSTQPRLLVFDALKRAFDLAADGNDYFTTEFDEFGDEIVAPEAAPRLIKVLDELIADVETPKTIQEIYVLFRLILTKYIKEDEMQNTLGYLLTKQLTNRPTGSAEATYTDIAKLWEKESSDAVELGVLMKVIINYAWQGFIVPYHAFAAPRPKNRYTPIIVNKYYSIRSATQRKDLDEAVDIIVEKIEEGRAKFTPFDEDFARMCYLMADTFIFRALTTLKQNPNSKVLIVMPSLAAIDKVKKALDDAGYPAETYTGRITNIKKRISIVRRFNQPNSNLRVIVGQLTAISNSVSFDDKDGRFPRYMYTFPTFSFLQEYQLIFRISRATSKSIPTVEFIYPKVEQSDILRNQRESRIRQDENLNQFGRVEGVEGFNLSQIPTIEEDPGEITVGHKLHFKTENAKKAGKETKKSKAGKTA